MALRVPAFVVLCLCAALLAGCSDDRPTDAPVTEGPSTSPSSGSVPAATTSNASAFQPVTQTWDGSSPAQACVMGACAGAPTSDCCESFDVPAGAGNVTVTVTWSDPAGRPLNVALYGVSEEGVIKQGASPLSVASPISPGSTSADLFVAQYVAAAGGASVESPVDFHVEVTFLA